MEYIIQPGFKRVEPELEQRILDTITLFKSATTAVINQELMQLMELGEKYRYL